MARLTDLDAIAASIARRTGWRHDDIVRVDGPAILTAVTAGYGRYAIVKWVLDGAPMAEGAPARIG